MSEQVLNFEEPADPRLFVDLDKLSEDGTTLVEQAKIINDNVYDIKHLLSDSWDTWIGADKQEYVKTLKRDVLQNLANYAEEINKMGTFMGKMYDRYSTQINSSVERLSDNE